MKKCALNFITFLQGLQFETWKSRVCHQVLAGYFVEQIWCSPELHFSWKHFHTYLHIWHWPFATWKGDAWKNICLEHNNTYLIKLRVPHAGLTSHMYAIVDGWTISFDHYVSPKWFTYSGNKAKGNTRCKFVSCRRLLLQAWKIYNNLPFLSSSKSYKTTGVVNWNGK